jgi:uncharacterized membrane protein
MMTIPERSASKIHRKFCVSLGVTMSIFPKFESAAHVRWLLLTSLALNVLFAGAAGAVAFRYTGTVPLTQVTQINHSVASRLDQIAATLPPADAQIMRAEFRADAVKVASAQADLRLSREELRNSLRAEPFDPNAMRAAMAASRTARDNFEQVMHDMIAAAAAKMSVVGRNKLADWPPARSSTATAQ